MENESDSYDNVRQDISLTQSMIPSDLTAHPNSIEPPVSAAPPNSIQPLVSAAPPNSFQPLVSAAPPDSIEHPVSAVPPYSIQPPVSAAPLNSYATVDQNEIPDAPPAYYASIDPPPPYSNPSQYPPTLGIPYLQNYPRGIPATGRPPHGQHYNYPPLGFVQPQGPKPHHHHHHQQQQQQVQQQQQRVITMDNQCQPATVVANQSSPVSMTGAILLACFVTWFCAYVCGLMALRMALFRLLIVRMESTDKNNLRAPGAVYPLYPPPENGYPLYPPPENGYPLYPPPEGGYPNYPQPEVGYPGPPPPANYQSPAPQRQFQQPQLVVVNSQPTGTTTGLYPGAAPAVSMTGAILLSCFVFWFGGWICGGIAFIVALIGQNSASGGNARGAIQLRNASYGLSIAGIVCGVVILAIYVIAYISEANKIASHNFITTTVTPRRCFNSYYNYYYDC